MSPDQPSAEVIDRVATQLQAQIGLRPDPFLRSRLGRGIRDEAGLHGQDIDGYLETLFVTDGVLQGLLNRVTVQETGFFRHPEHFQVLASDVLPTLPQPVKVWSAGCANGQEAFSLAMLLDEQGIDGSVIATDLSTRALERTSAARYEAREISGLSPDRIARHLVQHGRTWQVNQSVRNRVSTLRHNLMSPLPDQVRTCHVVFCRNVLIYFSPQHTKAFLDRVASTLPDAWLFLGAAETMWTVSDRYETIRIGEAYTYRPRVASAAASTLAATPPSLPDPRRMFSKATRLQGKREAAQGFSIAAAAPRMTRRQAPSSDVSHDRSIAPEAESAVTVLARTGALAMSAGDHAGAVVQFRKWAYLAHDDAVAHLHLGLALEAAGDKRSAQRAFGAARRALQEADPAHVEDAIGGYAPAELLRLLDAKQVVTP